MKQQHTSSTFQLYFSFAEKIGLRKWKYQINCVSNRHPNSPLTFNEPYVCLHTNAHLYL